MSRPVKKPKRIAPARTGTEQARWDQAQHRAREGDAARAVADAREARARAMYAQVTALGLSLVEQMGAHTTILFAAYAERLRAAGESFDLDHAERLVVTAELSGRWLVGRGR